MVYLLVMVLCDALTSALSADGVAAERECTIWPGRRVCCLSGPAFMQASGTTRLALSCRKPEIVLDRAHTLDRAR
jgi:hypothetical protein